MPRYRNEAGVVVNVSEDMARLVGGLTPVDQSPTELPADPDAVTAWLAAEQAHVADVTAWLAAETAATTAAETKQAARVASGHAGRK
jgi:hypothetical protein